MKYLTYCAVLLTSFISFANPVIEPVASKKLFRANYVHHGHDQKLWLHDDTAIMQLSEQNGQWQWAAPNRLPLPQPAFSERITHLQSSEQQLWFVYQNSLYSIKRTSTGIDATSLQSALLPQYGNNNQLRADRVTAMRAVFSTADLFLTEQDSAENAVLHRYRLTSAGISKIGSFTTDCYNANRMYASDAHLLLHCSNNTYRLYAISAEQLTETARLDGIEPIFMAPGNNTFIYLDNKTQELVWLNLDDTTESRQVKNFLDLQLVNPQGDALVRGYTANNDIEYMVMQRQVDNSFAMLGFDPDHPFASFIISNNSADIESLLYINGEHVLLGGGRSLISAESGKISFVADDLIHQLRTTRWPQVLANDSFIIMDSNGSQIWQINDYQLPDAPILTPRLTRANNVAVQAKAATGYLHHWWQVGYSENNWYLQHIQADGSTQQTQFAAQAMFDLKLQYFPSVDGLMLVDYSSDVWWCDNATALNASHCQQVLSLDRSSSAYRHTFTQNGILIHQANNEGNLYYYQANATGLALQWQMPFPHAQLTYWPGLDKVWINQTGQDGNASTYTEIALATGQATDNLRSNPAPNLELCLWSTDLLFCQNSGSGIHFKQLNTSQTDILAFYPNFSLLHSGSVVSANQSSQIILNVDMLYQYQIAIPQVGVGLLPNDSEVWQDDNLLLDFSTIANAEVTLSWFAYGGSTEQNLSWFSNAGNKLWQLNSSNEVARFSPLINVTATITSADWQALHSFNIKLHNINDAPLAAAPEITTEPLESGESYELTLSDIFIDPDGDGLVYQVGAMPAGFSYQAGSIFATPSQTGEFSFTVTATDSYGLTASSLIKITVIAKTSPAGNQSSGGGSLSFWSMLLLIAACLLRSRRTYQYVPIESSK